MAPVVTELKRLLPEAGVKVERSVEMREQRPSPRRLPLQALAQALAGKGDQHQILLPGKILGERAFKLIAGGQVDEAIASVGG